MSEMNQYLADYFGAEPSEDELHKQASAEMFLKLAEEEGIDIDELSDEQVEELYNATFADEEDVGDLKVAQAYEEWAGQKEAADKLAEAEGIGRVMGQTMAHSYVEELNKIAAKPINTRPGRGSAADKAKRKRFTGKVKHEAKRLFTSPVKYIRSGYRQARGSHAAIKNINEATRGGARLSDAGRAGLSKLKSSRIRGSLRLGLPVAAAAGALGAAGYGTKKVLEKKASAVDEYAGELAVEKLAHAGFNVDEAVDRISAVMTLDNGEMSKIAYADDLEEAVDIRSLELAELAGYPVEWAE